MSNKIRWNHLGHQNFGRLSGIFWSTAAAVVGCVPIAGGLYYQTLACSCALYPVLTWTCVMQVNLLPAQKMKYPDEEESISTKTAM